MLVEGLPDLVVVGQVQHHAAHVGLVRDLRRVDLQHHRIADAASQRHASSAVRAARGLVTGNSVGLQERLGDVLREDLAPSVEDRRQTPRSRCRSSVNVQRNVARRFVEDLEIAGVGDQVHERRHGFFGVV